MKKTKTRTIVRCALIASLYTAVSLVLAPIAFGAVQARVSEAFTLLPVLVPDAVVGVTLGCFLTNLVGVFTGANVLGALDIVFGTAATLTAALCTRRLARVRLRGLPVAAAVPPVLINAVVVGAELAWAFGPRTFAGFLLQAGGVAGKKTPYLVFAMSDETFSVNVSACPPEGVDRGWFMFWVSLLDQFYWVAASALGGLLGRVLTVSTKGIEFVMTALFVTIFTGQWMEDREHRPALVGLGASVLCLALFGAGNFILPAMALIVLLLLVMRPALDKKGAVR